MRAPATHFLCIALSMLLLIACGDEQAPPQDVDGAKPFIVAINNPLLYFAQRLVGDKVEVRLLAPPDIDPALWQPAAQDVLQMQAAALVLLNGAGYSGWLNKVSLSPGKMVTTAGQAREQWIEIPNEVTHSHGPKGAHAHGSYAITTWMDISLALLQAEATAEALQRRRPELGESITENLGHLSVDLRALDKAYQQHAKHMSARQLVYSHPVYQYFERRYQLPGRSVHWEPDVMPSDDQWRDLARTLSDTSLFMWESEPDAAISERMMALGLEYVVLDPAANLGDKDWLAVQKDNLRRLKSALLQYQHKSGGKPLTTSLYTKAIKRDVAIIHIDVEIRG